MSTEVGVEPPDALASLASRRAGRPGPPTPPAPLPVGAALGRSAASFGVAKDEIGSSTGRRIRRSAVRGWPTRSECLCSRSQGSTLTAHARDLHDGRALPAVHRRDSDGECPRDPIRSSRAVRRKHCAAGSHPYLRSKAIAVVPPQDRLFEGALKAIGVEFHLRVPDRDWPELVEARLASRPARSGGLSPATASRGALDDLPESAETVSLRSLPR